MIHYTHWLKNVYPPQVISFLAAILHKKGTREDIENNMPEFLLRSLKKEPPSSIAKKVSIQLMSLILQKHQETLKQDF